MNKTTIIIIVVIVVLIIGLSIFAFNKSKEPGKYDVFAQCLGENGATFFGAFWCPHCQSQKALFGKSSKHLPYVECSTPNGQDQNQICDEEGIEGYPTWRFADGSELGGEIPLQTLSEKTGCELPL